MSVHGQVQVIFIYQYMFHKLVSVISPHSSFNSNIYFICLFCFTLFKYFLNEILSISEKKLYLYLYLTGGYYLVHVIYNNGACHEFIPPK